MKWENIAVIGVFISFVTNLLKIKQNRIIVILQWVTCASAGSKDGISKFPEKIQTPVFCCE